MVSRRLSPSHMFNNPASAVVRSNRVFGWELVHTCRKTSYFGLYRKVEGICCVLVSHSSTAAALNSFTIARKGLSYFKRIRLQNAGEFEKG